MTGPEHFRWAQNKFDWSPDKIARLTELWAKGKSGSEIAALLGGGLSRSAVIGKVHRLNLPTRSGIGRENNRQTAKLWRKQTTAQRYGQGKSAHVAPALAKRPHPLPLPPPEPKSACAVKFEDLSDGMCRYPADTPEGLFFCGCNSIPGKSWCEHHNRVVFQPIADQAPRRRPIPQPQLTFYDLEKENA
jgi:GcrA cell cycle regulator